VRQQQPFGQAEPQLTKAPHEHGRAAMLLARTAVDGSTPRRTGAGQQELEKQLVNAFSRAITIADDAASGPRCDKHSVRVLCMLISCLSGFVGARRRSPVSLSFRIQVRSSPRVSESVTSDAEFKRAGDRLAATEQGLGYDEAFQRGWKDRLAEAGNQEYQDFASHVNSNLLDAPQAAVTAAASSGPIPIHPSSPTRTLSSEAPPATASTAAASSSSSAGSLSIPSIDDLTKSLGRIAHSFREIGDPLAAKTTKTEVGLSVCRAVRAGLGLGSSRRHAGVCVISHLPLTCGCDVLSSRQASQWARTPFCKSSSTKKVLPRAASTTTSSASSGAKSTSTLRTLRAKHLSRTRRCYRHALRSSPRS
jgi:hypothetical protein